MDLERARQPERAVDQVAGVVIARSATESAAFPAVEVTLRSSEGFASSTNFKRDSWK